MIFNIVFTGSGCKSVAIRFESCHWIVPYSSISGIAEQPVPIFTTFRNINTSYRSGGKPSLSEGRKKFRVRNNERFVYNNCEL